MSKQIADYSLYKWRYVIGYSLIGIVIIGLLVYITLLTPGGLSDEEIKSTVSSGSLSFSLNSFDPRAIINLPYHLLQRASISIFGLSSFTIKLPSLLLGLLSSFGILILLKQWFRANIAVISTILILTTGQFLYIAQSGSEAIMYIFSSVWLLVAALMISRRAKFVIVWKILLFIIAALSLYTPLSAYILFALLAATTLHPHLRFIVKRLTKSKVIIAGAVGLVLLVPLGYAIFKDTSIGLILLGIPDHLPDLSNNASIIVKQYANFISPSRGVLMNPIYGLGTTILIAIGIVNMLTTKHTAKSYIALVWIVSLMPALILNPQLINVTFVPVILFIATGISYLLNSWYKLFPQNPYARIVGLAPLAILIGGMVFTGLERYMYGYTYSPHTANLFSQDLSILNNALKENNSKKILFIVDKTEKPFYELTSTYYSASKVAVNTPIETQSADVIVVSKNAKVKHIPNRLSLILTNDKTDNSARFYVYKTK